MALTVNFADGESSMIGVDSWSTSEEVAGFAVRDKGTPSNFHKRENDFYKRAKDDSSL